MPRPNDPGHQAGWDRNRDGSMADYAAEEDAVTTVDGDETGDFPDAS